MVKVYRPDGVAEEKEAVDARECVEHCGYSYEPHEPLVHSDESLKVSESTENRTLDYPGATGEIEAVAKKSRGKTAEQAPVVEQVPGVEQIHDPND